MATPLSRQANSQIAQPEVGFGSQGQYASLPSELTLELSQDPRDRRQTPSSDSYMAPGTSMALMGPPPFPVDTSPWTNTSVFSPDLDGLLYPGNGPVPLLHERSPLPGASGSATRSPEFHLPSIRETDSVASWYDDPAAPWTSLRQTGSTGQPMISQHTPQRTSPAMNPRSYREASRSEVSGPTTRHHHFDSTYGSRSLVSNSEGSLDQPNPSQGGQSVAMEFNGLHFNNGSRSTYRTASTASQDDHYSSLDGSSDTSQRHRAPASLACPYDECAHISKNNSEQK